MYSKMYKRHRPNRRAQFFEESGRRGAIDDHVIDRQRQADRRFKNHSVAFLHGFWIDATNTEDADFGRVEHRREAFDPGSAQITDAEGRTAQLVRGDRRGAAGFGQTLSLVTDLLEA